MKLKRIFGDDNSEDGLYAIQYPGCGEDEFERLFDCWNDAQYVHEYCIANKDYLAHEHFEGSSIDAIEMKIVSEAIRLEAALEEYTHGAKNLQEMFKALSLKESEVLVLQQSKAKAEKIYKPLLRIYGIRLGENTFVITGGAIKLTHYMKDHPATTKELEKLTRVKNFLKDNGIETTDDITYYYEQS